jgi:hypothetical protein
MRDVVYKRLLTSLKWAAYFWCYFSIAVVLLSNVMISRGWNPIMKFMPFNVRDPIDTAILMAPGPIALLLHWLLTRGNRSRRPGPN